MDAPVDVTIILPLYDPAPSPPGFTVTFILPGVVPLVGDAMSHGVDVETVKGKTDLLLVTERACPTGIVDPIR